MNGRIPLVLLPGLLCDSRLWRHQMDSLVDIADISVIDLARDDTMAGMAARVLAEAPPRFALAGLSMGGYAAFAVMHAAPERVMRLAVLDSSARADTPERREERLALNARVEAGQFAEIPSMLLRTLIHPARHGDRVLRDTILSMAFAIGAEGFLRQQAAIMTRPDSRPGLGLIDCPTLVLCGRQDARTPVMLHEEIAAAIPGAKLVVLEECGHMSTLERPDLVTAALRAWLQRP
jgi:pimeloyl-ACP methyl ester carboxylesterase